MPNLTPDWLPWIRPNGRLIWFSIIFVIMLVPIFVALRRPKSDLPTTWAQAMGGSVYTFALFFLGFAIIPHEFITVSDKYWALSTDRFLIKSTTAIPFAKSLNWPFSIDLQHGVRDLLVVAIYGVILGGAIALIVLWQKRPTRAEVEAREPVEVGRSRFGRPLKARA